jgi:hypothetical protein
MDARAETPEPKARAYMPVEDIPSKRDNLGMTADEVSKLKKDLGDTRDRQAAKAKSNMESSKP